MSLDEFKPPRYITRQPYLTVVIERKTNGGYFYINASAVRKFKLQNFDFVTFLHDKKEGLFGLRIDKTRKDTSYKITHQADTAARIAARSFIKSTRLLELTEKRRFELFRECEDTIAFKVDLGGQ